MTKTKTKTAQEKYKTFISLTEKIAADLYTNDEWSKARKQSEKGIGLELLEMQSTVYDKAFEINPSCFKGIQWINSDCDIPAWVRPGVEWRHDVD